MGCKNKIYPVLLPVPEECRTLKGVEKVRFLKNHARKALEISCQKGGFILRELKQAENGAGLPENGVFWSLSHKNTLVGAVAAPVPVGIDVERIQSRSDALLDRVANDREWQLAHGDRSLNFYRFWTAKEAVLKAAGDGLSGLSECRIHAVQSRRRHLTIHYRKKEWPVEHFFHEDHIASITCGTCELEWIIASGAP